MTYLLGNDEGILAGLCHLTNVPINNGLLPFQPSKTNFMKFKWGTMTSRKR